MLLRYYATDGEAIVLGVGTLRGDSGAINVKLASVEATECGTRPIACVATYIASTTVVVHASEQEARKTTRVLG